MAGVAGRGEHGSCHRARERISRDVRALVELELEHVEVVVIVVADELEHAPPDLREEVQ